jgi:hypothetical protein
VVTGLLLLWAALQTLARDPHAGACGAKCLFTPSPLASTAAIVTRHQDEKGTEKPRVRTALAVSPRMINLVPGSRHFG